MINLTMKALFLVPFFFLFFLVDFCSQSWGTRTLQNYSTNSCTKIRFKLRIWQFVSNKIRKTKVCIPILFLFLFIIFDPLFISLRRSPRKAKAATKAEVKALLDKPIVILDETNWGSKPKDFFVNSPRRSKRLESPSVATEQEPEKKKRRRNSGVQGKVATPPPDAPGQPKTEPRRVTLFFNSFRKWSIFFQCLCSLFSSRFCLLFFLFSVWFSFRFSLLPSVTLTYIFFYQVTGTTPLSNYGATTTRQTPSQNAKQRVKKTLQF